MLGHESDAPVQVGIVASGFSENTDRALRALGQSGDHVKQRRLARAVGAEQSGDAGKDLQGHVVDGHDAAEPLRYLIDLDGSAVCRCACVGHVAILL